MTIWENNFTQLYDPANRQENLEVEIEKEVDVDQKDPYILQTELEKAIKEIWTKKATGDGDIPGDVLKLLGDDSLRLMKQLINNVQYMKLESGPRISLKLQSLPQRQIKKLQNAAIMAQSASSYIQQRQH
jgi:hypothetical protein